MPRTPAMKQCPGCKRTLPLTEYSRHKGHGKDNRESRCKACMAEIQRNKVASKRPVDYPAPIPYQFLAKEQQQMVERTPDGFKKFFEKYSGLPLHEHGYVWAQVALENDLLLLNVPPGHAKTTIMAQWYTIWTVACDRNAQVIVVSKTIDGARKTAYKIAYELEFNRALNLDFGRFRPKDHNVKWSTGDGALVVDGKDQAEGSGDVSVQIRGMGQQILGMRATLVIADDAADRKVARSEVQRVEQLEWFLGDVMSRLQPGGKATCIGQRVHMEDLYGELAKLTDHRGEPVWAQVETPAILDWEEEEVLWPERWPFEELLKIQARQGSALFETMYQQNPESAGEFIRKAWIEGSEVHPGCLDRGRLIGQGWKNEDATQMYLPVTRVISIDPSPRQYCGIVVADVVYVPNQTTFACTIVDIRRGKFGLREMVEQIEDLTLSHRPSVCIFEENSAKWLHEDPTWNLLVPMFRKVIKHNTVAGNKQDPLMGVWSLGADFEAGRIRLPYGDAEAKDISSLLISEALSYPNGKTDDVLMALWFIKPNFRQLMPLDHIATRFNRGIGAGGTWKGW